jgi:hypothetical protein
MMQYVEKWRNSAETTRAGLVESVRTATHKIMDAVVPNYPRISHTTEEVVYEVRIPSSLLLLSSSLSSSSSSSSSSAAAAV